VLLGALEVVLPVGEIAELLHLSREMELAGFAGSRVDLDIPLLLWTWTAKVTTLRDFFISCSSWRWA